MERSEQNEEGRSLKVLLVEPFYGGAHRIWADRTQTFSRHDIELLTLDGKYWKWRMRGGAPILAREYLKRGSTPDLILSSSMLDLPSFLGSIAKEGARTPPVVHYFHENQLLYPVPDDREVFKEQRDSFGAINFRSAIVADRLFFNSHFHKEAGIRAFRDLIQRAPDHNEMELLEGIEERSFVFPPAPDLLSLDGSKDEAEEEGPTILWNHRWEPEKGPEGFDRTLRSILDEREDVSAILLGPSGSAERIRQNLAKDYPEQVLFAGEASSFDEYREWLNRANISLVHSHQDFFGLSVVEAMYCGIVPILPDRLAFPEHLTSVLEVLLYRGAEEARSKALSLIDGSWRPDRKELRRAVAPYDVREWIEIADEELEATAMLGVR